MGTAEHKKKAPHKVRVGILSVSSTRGLADDKSGIWMKKRAQREGHEVVSHRVVPDHSNTIARTIQDIISDNLPHVILVTGGTGIGGSDVTIEAVRPMFEKELTAFGALFAQLSFEEIDSAAILSRATAGVVEKVGVFCMPGSLKACKLACKALIFPELGHLVKHIREA